MSLFQQLVGFFSGNPVQEDQEPEHPLLPRAALLLEAATYDDDFAQEEREKIAGLLQNIYGVEAHEVEPLLKLAAEKSHGATDLYDLTRELSNNLSLEERFELMCELWMVVLADGVVHKNEELFVRKMQKLLRMDHSAWIKAKLQAGERLKG